MFLFAEYVEMILLSAILTVLFFGGWQIPWIDGQGYHFWQWLGQSKSPIFLKPRGGSCPGHTMYRWW
jgi:NADH:ubiquinone oxidoreductase subunit H